MTARAISAARLGILVATTLCAALLVVGCGTGGSGSTDAGTTPPSGDASAVATPAGDTTGDKISDTTAPTPAATVDRAEIERRLALPRFAYVAESERQGAARAFGALAFIDSEDRHPGLPAARRQRPRACRRGPRRPAHLRHRPGRARGVGGRRRDSSEAAQHPPARRDAPPSRAANDRHRQVLVRPAPAVLLGGGLHARRRAGAGALHRRSAGHRHGLRPRSCARCPSFATAWISR